MIKQICPICETNQFSHLVYDQNLPNLTDADFSGRKNPDGYHYEMVRCKKCSLLYASSIYETEILNKLYQNSDFDYLDELQGLKKTYNICLKESEKFVKNKSKLLEIGSGNGFFLECAKKSGWDKVIGFEPSIKAYSSARNDIKKNLINSSFEYDENYSDYNLIFFAMLIEHVPNVNIFLRDVHKTLSNDGLFMGIAHNEDHFLAKILKSNHPIINDEHNYVFSKKTIEKILIKNNFKILKIDDLRNYYTLNYWLKMLPKPKFLNYFSFELNFLKKINLGISAGNFYFIAKKS